MKRSLYKVISFIVAVCIIISVVPVFAFVSADGDNIPDRPLLTDKNDIIISQQGVESTFGSKYNNLPGNTKNTINPTIDLTKASNIEFDVYVESAQNLKIAMDGYSSEKEQKLLFGFSSATVSALFVTQQTATIDITPYIVNDGWNHISVSKKDFVGTNIRWGNIKYAFLRFEDNANAEYSAVSNLQNNKVALVNICSVYNIPDDATVLYKELYKSTLGQSEESLISDVSKTFTKNELETVSFNNYYVFFDFKVSDFTTFSQLLQSKKLEVSLYSNLNSATATIEPERIMSSGNMWKRLKICVDEFNTQSGFNWGSVDGFSFGFLCADENEKLDEFYSLELSIGGVYASVDNPAKPEIDNRYTTVTEYYGEITRGILTEKFDFEFNYSDIGNPFNWTGTEINSYTYETVRNAQSNEYFDNIEFDLYVEDSELFVNSLLSKNNTLKFSFYSNGKNDDKNTIVVEIPAEDVSKYINHNGWNHIIIDAYNDLVKIADDCEFDYARVTGWKLSFGGTTTNINSSSGYPIQIANICTTIKRIAAPEINNKYVTVSEYYKDMSYDILGSDFSFSMSHSNVGVPFDLTASGLDTYTYKTVHDIDKDNKYFNYLEFDIYIDDIDEFISACEAKENTLILRLNSNGSTGNADCVYMELSLNAMKKFFVKDGWNHVVMESNTGLKKGNSTGDFDFTKVTEWSLYFGGNVANENSANGQVIEIANICATINKIEKPVINNKHKLVTEYYNDIIIKTLEYNFSWQKIVNHKENPIDWTAAGVDSYTMQDVVQKDFLNRYFDTLEFDFYVADLDEFCSALAANNNQVRLRFYTSGVAIGESQLLDIRFTGDKFAHLLTNDGWNHITIATDEFTYKGTPDFTKITSWLIDFVGTLSNYNSAFGQKIAIANLCITDDIEKPNNLDAPTLPENVITKIEEESAHALGAYFGYTSDRIFAEGIGPYDFSKGNSIEFDLYVSDYETLKKSFEECPRGDELYLVFSSVPLKLFSQYTKPRTYYSVQCGLRKQITKTGWNHIKLGKTDFVQLLGTMDWSNITSFMLRYSKSKFNQKDAEEKNPAGEVRIKIANIVNTGIISDVPYDEEKPKKPDNDAVYINDAENLIDDNGSWNPSEVYVDENYKSENLHSVLRNISYETEKDFARMFYLFDYSADMSDIKTLKFDLFIDISQFIKKSGNILEIGLSTKRNFSGNYTWKIDTSVLNDGWNSIEVNISDAQKNGNVSLEEIKTVFLRFTELNLSAENYESILIGIDNLRYISDKGNTVLKINDGMDDEDDYFDDNSDENTDDTSSESDSSSDTNSDENADNTSSESDSSSGTDLDENVNNIISNSNNNDDVTPDENIDNILSDSNSSSDTDSEENADDTTSDFGNNDNVYWDKNVEVLFENSDDDISNPNVEIIVEKETETVIETITLEPKTIHLKETVNRVVTNYVAAIIILAIEFVVLSVAVIVGYILIKKKRF